MAKSMMKFCFMIMLISNIILLSTAITGSKNLCDQTTGVIEKSDVKEWNFSATNCKTNNPSALVFYFTYRKFDCYSTCGNSFFQVSERTIFNTCTSGTGNCYIFANGDTALEMLSGLDCKYIAFQTFNQFPKVTFKYKTCYQMSKFILNYTYIVKESDRKTTPILTTLNFTSEKSTAQPSTPVSSVTSTGSTPYMLRENDPTQKPKTAPRNALMETNLSIAFGVSFLVTLLALVALTIRHRRVISIHKSQPLPLDDAHDANDDNNEREVVVNELYDSCRYPAHSGEQTFVNKTFMTEKKKILH